MPLKTTLKQKFISACKRYNLPCNKEYYKIFLIDMYRKQKEHKSTNIKNFFDLLQDMLSDDYKNKSLLERYKLFYTFSSQARTIEKYKCRYGDKLGQKKWDIYCNKQAKSNTFEYKQKKYGWTKEQFNEYNNSRAITLENCIKRYGKEIGIQIFNNYCKKQAYAGVKLEYFIEKYGENIGTKKYYNMLENKIKPIISLLDNVSSTFEKNVINQLINEGIVFLGNATYNIDKNGNEYIDTVNFQFHLFDKQLNKHTFFDACILDKHILLEINGDFWHCNKRNKNVVKFLETTKSILREDIIYHAENDKIKLQIAENAGFRVYTIWEMDWKKNSQKIIDHFKLWMDNDNKSFSSEELFNEDY